MGVQKYLKLRNWSIFAKVFGISLVTIVSCFMSVYFILIPLYEKQLLNERREAASRLVDAALSIVKSNDKQVQLGLMQKYAAQKASLETLRVLRYGNNDYFWVHDLDFRMHMHPAQADFKNQNLKHLLIF